MKRIFSFGFGLILSLMVCGWAAAEEELLAKKEAAVESEIKTEFPSVKKEAGESQGILVATGQNCEPFGAVTCGLIESICCDSSPIDADREFCWLNWRWVWCKDCWHSCGSSE